MQKSHYRIQNWSDYNKALIQRGSINLWIDQLGLAKWTSITHTEKAGRPATYSNEAILMLLIIREVFHLTLRSLVGFARSIFQLMKLDLPVPSYTQICRRAKTLHKKIKRLTKRPINHIILDSTGLKMYGEGEWKVRTHGKKRMRVWRKFHIAIDAETQDFVICDLTTHSVGEAKPAARMLNKIPGKIKTVRGDGGYDPNIVRKTIYAKGARAIIPPPRHASIKGATTGWVKDRDEDISTILSYGNREVGRRPWKEKVHYFKRSLIETSILRIKTMFGEKLKCRNLGSQRTESFCKCLAINMMNELGLPKGKWITGG
jgi:transposase